MERYYPLYTQSVSSLGLVVHDKRRSCHVFFSKNVRNSPAIPALFSEKNLATTCFSCTTRPKEETLWVYYNSEGLESGKTALYRAAEYGNLSKVRILLDNGAIALKDSNGKIPADLIPVTVSFPEEIMKQLKGAAPPVRQNHSLTSVN